MTLVKNVIRILTFGYLLEEVVEESVQIWLREGITCLNAIYVIRKNRFSCSGGDRL